MKTLPNLKFILALICCAALPSFADMTSSAAKPTPAPATLTTAPTPPTTNTTPATKTPPAEVTSAKAAPANTAPLVAKVIWVKGAFTALTPTLQSRTLSKDAPVYLHDTLVTDANTQAEIVFTDNTLMTFRPNTKFYVDQYEYSSDGKTTVGKYVMRLIEGGFRTITGLIAKNNHQNYQVNTPVATIGVRGTEYSVYYDNGELFVGYHHGSPCVNSLDPKQKTLCLDSATPYAQVPYANAAPVPVTQQPAVFKQSITVVPATFGSGGPGGPGGPGGTMPNGDAVKGFMSNFCIQ